MTPVVLLVGQKDAGKRTVATVLSTYASHLLQQQQQPAPPPPPPPPSSSASTTTSPLTTSSVRVLGKGILATTYNLAFNNKYYTAAVEVWAVQTTKDADELAMPANCVVQAVVGVFDGTPSSNTDTKDLVQQLGTMNDTFNPDVVALIATRGGISDNTKTECAAHHWLEVLKTEAIAAPMLTCMDRNKEGIPRLHELLETVMWQSMCLKPRGGGGEDSDIVANSNTDNQDNQDNQDNTDNQDNSSSSTETKEPNGQQATSVSPCCAFVSTNNVNNIAVQVANQLALFNTWHHQVAHAPKEQHPHPDLTQFNASCPPTTTTMMRSNNQATTWKYPITNKYYTAAAQVIAHDLELGEDAETLAHDLRDVQCHALVGVALVPTSASTDDAEDPTLATRNLLKRIQRATGTSTTFLMVVGECNDDDDQKVALLAPTVRQTCVDWCLENHAEMIIVEHYKENITNTVDSREKTGYARLHEALSAVQWSNALFKQDSTTPAGVSSIRKVHTAVAPTTAPTTAPTLGTPPSHKEEEEVAVEEEQEQASNFDGVDSDAFWDAMQSAVRTPNTGDGEDGMDDLSSLVSQARAVRRAGEQGTMTDEERHEAAMRVAMQLAAVMGLNEDDL